jgi:hypothetical protein
MGRLLLGGVGDVAISKLLDWSVIFRTAHGEDTRRPAYRLEDAVYSICLASQAINGVLRD